MNRSTIIPAIVLGAASIVMSAGACAGVVHSTENAANNIGNAGVGFVGGVLHGTGQVVTGVLGGTARAVNGAWYGNRQVQYTHHYTHHHMYHQTPHHMHHQVNHRMKHQMTHHMNHVEKTHQ